MSTLPSVPGLKPKASKRGVKRAKILDGSCEKQPTQPKKNTKKKSDRKEKGGKKNDSGYEIDLTDPKAYLFKPKKNIKGYAFFIKEKKTQFAAGKKDNKIAPVLMKEFGKEWSGFTEEQKKSYMQKARDDKVRYEREFKEFAKKCGSIQRIRQWENKRPKKALSSYMIFVKETRAKV